MANDILLNNEDDLIIENGDLKVDYVDNQNIDLVLRSFQGNWKNEPFIGFGIAKYLNAPLDSNTKRKLLRDLRIQLKLDGASNIKIEFNDELKVSADYGS